MSRNKIIEDTENNIGEPSFNESITDSNEADFSSKDTLKTRKRIDELLEKKRLKELLDEDEWDL